MSFGRKIQCLAWAPNQEGLSQYLAVVVPITEAQKKNCSSLGADSRNAFQPTPAYPCALQVWEFKGKEIDCSTKSLDMSIKPQRRLVVCTNWGDIRSIAWCPMPRQERPEDSQGDTQSIGLLAGIWGDGKVRVLDIKVHRDSSQEEYGMPLIHFEYLEQFKRGSNKLFKFESPPPFLRLGHLRLSAHA
jgi:transcription factor C subunit 6